MTPIRLLSAALGAVLLSGLVFPALGQDFDAPALGSRALPAGKASVLKVCKVAGEGVRVGEEFVFGAKPAGGKESVSIPAGPGPGGWCQVVGTYEPGSQVVVQERIPGGYGVDGISVVPAGAQLSQVVGEGKVTVRLGKGVTEVTIVDSKRTGYIEICKTGGRDAAYEFSYAGRDGAVRKVRVPAGACSPALEVPAGELAITELLPEAQMRAVEVWPAARLVKVEAPQGRVRVQVPPGDISTQTIISISN